MNELKGKQTPGKWKASKAQRQYDPDCDVYEVHWSDIGECVAEVVHGEANAALFAEAGNVANETGLWPREMAEQRAELLEALKVMLSGWAYMRQVHDDLSGAGWDRCEARARAAVAKAEGGVAP